MGFSRRNDIVPAIEVTNTKEMTLKIISVQKQECISRINKAKQDIEDLKLATR